MKQYFRQRVFIAALLTAGMLFGSVSYAESDTENPGEDPYRNTETEFDWAAFAADAEDEEDFLPELEDDEDFLLDLDYIASYGGEYCSDLIFYGDSRVVGMSYTADSYHYVGKEGAGYSWMSGEGLTYLEEQMKSWPDADIVFCFGVNDLGNLSSYISFYQSFEEKYPDRRFWYMSVTPVYDGLAASSGSTVKNADIETFNQGLETAFPEQYLDCYSYLKEYGYNAQDGIHYDGDTYFGEQDYCRRLIMNRLDSRNENP